MTLLVMLRKYHKNNESVTCETFDLGNNLLCFQSFYVSGSDRRDNYFAINYGLSREEFFSELFRFRRYVNTYIYDGLRAQYNNSLDLI